MDLNRRNFLKTVAVTTAGSMLPGCEREAHRLVPFLLPDDEIVPGKDTWYASVCRECEAGCGVLVRTMEGRAKKIEGNPLHPVNRGKLCAQGQAALQGHYNPDRLRTPLKRDGAGAFQPIGWDEGLALWIEQIRAQKGRAAMISRPVAGTLGDLFARFMDTIGGELLSYDPGGIVPVLNANRAGFGVQPHAVPFYDLAHADYVLSFGAPFLEHWLSPVAFGAAYGHMRQGRAGMRGRLVHIEPRLSLTAANADRWIPIRPGTEGMLAMGIGHVILNEGRSALPASMRNAFRAAFGAIPLKEIAADTDVPETDIVGLAREFSRAAAPLAFGGGTAVAHTNGTLQLMVIHALNALAGNVGQPGGLHFLAPPDFPAGAPARPGRTVGEQALLDLAGEVRAGRRTLLHLYHSNPLFSLPPSTESQDLFDKAEFVVSFSPFMDESTAKADLILPDHSPLESWSDHVSAGPAGGLAIGLGQPAVIPLYDTRAVGDVVLEAARRLDDRTAKRFPWSSFSHVLRERWSALLADTRSQEPFDEAWIRTLQRGGWWDEGHTPLPATPHPPPAYERPLFDGRETEFPFFFYPYSSVALGDGRGANRPWLQELPDPLTTAVWGSWVELNPETARAHGLQPGEVVRVISPYGLVEAPVVFFPGMRPDLVGMPIGQGHRAYGRYAQNRGVNPLTLVGPSMDPRAGCLATGATRVKIERTGRQGRLVLIDQTGKNAGGELITIGTNKR